MKLLGIALLLLGWMSSVSALTIHVPADQPTIQAGVTASMNSDTVLVAPGIYSGDGNRDIDFQGKRIILKSESGTALTVIDCDGSPGTPHRAFYFHSTEDSTATVEGFTITDANDVSGAVYCLGSGAKLSHCVISGNVGNGVRRDVGAGVQAWLIIDSCSIVNNTQDGVYVTKNFAVRNSNLSYNLGRGLWAEDPGADAAVAFSTFADNGAAGMGGRSFAGRMPRVSNCTFVRNSDGLACVLDLPVSADITAYPPPVENCIMAFNKKYGYGCYGYVQPLVTCCDAYGNGLKDWITSYGTPQAGDTLGNISLDPLFCDTSAGDFRLSDASPCTPARNRCQSLVGALEVGCVCCAGTTGDVNMSGVADASDLAWLVSHLTGTGVMLPCPNEANVDMSGIIDSADLSSLVSYLTGAGFVLPNCP